MSLHRHWSAFCLLTALAMLGIAGCSKKTSIEPSSAASGVQGVSASAAFLAYEHQVWVKVPTARLDAQMAAVREACMSGAHGRCSLLEVSQSAGEHADGKISLRVVAGGVEPLVGIAAAGGEQTRRSTQAEDLGQAVADTTRQVEQLQLQRALLLEFQQRKELSVSDMLSIARELADLESSLAAAEREAARQTLRLETNLLTIEFDTPREPESRMARLREAFGGSVDSSIDGLVQAIEIVTYVLPLLIFGFPLALLWRWLWRRATRTRAP